MRLRDLTDGEQLRLERRRRGASQPEWAEWCGVTLYRYRAWETDAEKPPAHVMPELGKLRDYEACHVLRMRSEIPLKALAKRLGVTPNWLCEIEHGRQPAARLVAYWRRNMKAR